MLPWTSAGTSSNFEHLPLSVASQDTDKISLRGAVYLCLEREFCCQKVEKGCHCRESAPV